MGNCSSESTTNGCGCSSGVTPEWLTLPVAPHASARSRFSGPDKLPQAVPVYGALSWVDDLKAKGTVIKGIDIDGPGDPMATLDMTLEILKLLREKHGELSFGITTLGFGLADNVEKLAAQGVSRVTFLMDGVSPAAIEKLYSWIRPGKRNMDIGTAAARLIAEQARGIEACKSAGITPLIKTSIYKSINEQEVAEIARTGAALGAESMTLLPGKGWLDSDEPLPLEMISTEKLAELATLATTHLTTETPSPDKGRHLCSANESCTCGSPDLPKATAKRPNVAALSSNGMDIDLHLGQAIKALIYGPREDGLPCLLEARDLPEPGCGEKRWQKVGEVLKDCFILLAESAGQKPQDILGKQGLPIVLIDDNVEGTVDVLYGGGKKAKCKKG